MFFAFPFETPVANEVRQIWGLGLDPISDIRDCCGRCYMWIVDFADRRSRPRSRTVLVRIYARPYLVPHLPSSSSYIGTSTMLILLRIRVFPGGRHG